MNLLFEDDGHIKAALIMSESDASAQVELPGGRRIKVKSSSVLMNFAQPDAATLMASAQKQLADIDMSLLWQSAEGRDELTFAELSQEYFGAGATPEQMAATVLALQQAPMYFYKRGKGRYKRAPEDALKAALISIERKAREAEQMESWVTELTAGRAPLEIASQWAQLLHAPDKQSLIYKALAAAADRARMSPVHLLAKSGAIPSTHALHFQKFLRATFPKGIAFPANLSVQTPADLPIADVRAFSIDDAATTEIDDAFSWQTLAAGGYMLGVHIAAPALAFAPDSDADRVARDRLSTVYMPGHKITMLPETLITEFSLDEGKTPPTLSLYATLDGDLNVLSTETRVERVPMSANLRINDLDALTWLEAANDATAAGGHAPELRMLHQFAQKLEQVRVGATPQINNRVDYNFSITGDADTKDSRIDITTRQRGSPVDTLVSELMIFANVSWAKLLADKGWTGMFRVQAGGKTKMSSLPGPHEGLNVPHYLWATSPLRRYSDLVNQRQLLAAVADSPAAYPRGSAELLAAVSDFDATYAAYADFQQQMEFYWCLRFIQQEGIEKLTARVIRENLVRFDRLPIVQRVNDMASQAPGTQVILAVSEIDLFEPALHLRFIEAVPGTANAAPGATATTAA